MSLEHQVFIAGGGPFGLMLAIELARRGVTAALFGAKPSTAFNPQANATQGADNGALRTARVRG